jgi:pyruvate formate lyase activating enzyme
VRRQNNNVNTQTDRRWSAWEVRPRGEVACRICAHACLLSVGEIGRCAVWRNLDGVLSSTAGHRAPWHQASTVERKPFYHCLPGSRTYSIGSHGCNLRCPGCLNTDQSTLNGGESISRSETLSPSELVVQAQSADCASITFAYAEPTIAIEQVEPIAAIARQNQLPCLVKTNGFLHSSSLGFWAELITAANIDLKAFLPSLRFPVRESRISCPATPLPVSRLDTPL